MPRLCFITLSAILLFASALPKSEPQAAAAPAPQPVLENDYVRVSKVILHAG